jgi:hypothetical protein
MLIAASMPLSKFGMSMGQFFMAGGWLLSGDFEGKKKRFSENKVVFWALAGLFFIHLIGLWNTSDFKYAWSDIRIKLPLLLMPLFFLTMPTLTVTQYRNVLRVVMSAVLVSTLISLGIYLGFSKRVVHDIRDISPFISHIRLALLVCTSMAIAIYFLLKSSSIPFKIALIAMIIWFFYFLVLIESITGLLIIAGAIFILLVVQLFSKKSNVLLKGAFMLSILATFFVSFQLYDFLFVESIKPIDYEKVKLYQITAAGNNYNQYKERQDLENDHPVWINVCEFELDGAWKSRSGTSVYDRNSSGYQHLYPLVRFLASKGWNKDAAAVMKLSDEEVQAIKSGVANVNRLNHQGGIKQRLDDLAWEYRSYYYNGNATGQSFTQRLEFWKTAAFIFSKQPFTGVGTGDVNEAFKSAYNELNSKLDEKWRLRSHNQYLSFAVAFGVFGMFYLIFALFYPFLAQKLWRNYLYSAFLFIAVFSMLSEDTLETQAGVTFFAFLNCFLLRNSASESVEEVKS